MGNNISEESFIKFENFIDSKNHGKVSDYIHNVYVTADDNEGYKFEIAKELEKICLVFWGQRRDIRHIGKDDEIIDFAKKIMSKASNLVNYNSVVAMNDALANTEHRGTIADLLRAFYCDNRDQEFFDGIRSMERCNRSDLLAFWMFSKDTEKYLPVRVESFNDVLVELGIGKLNLKKEISWENYIEYIDIVEKVRQMLIDRYPTSGISRLDAHNFLWIYKRYNINDLNASEHVIIPKGEEVPVPEEMRGRKGQSKYRKGMLEIWGGRCAVTECANSSLLVASHAKPYSHCFSSNGRCDDDAYNPYNGLLLALNYDALFDAGFITFDSETGELFYSKSISKKDLLDMGINPKAKLRMIPKNCVPYLDYHRKNVFIG